MRGTSSLLLVLSASAALGCGSSASGSGASGAADAPAPVELPPSAWQEPWRILALPDAGEAEVSVAATPRGWFAVSHGGPGSSYAYRSEDGTHWQRSRLTDDDRDLYLSEIAYGNGLYVIVGARHSTSGNLVLVSKDGETWEEPLIDANGAGGLERVAYAHGHFFGMETDVWTSSDAEHWHHTKLDGAFEPVGVAFGAGHFVLVGNGALQLSSDGVTWSPAPIDCALPSACISDYDGGTATQNTLRSVLFADGYFYVNALRSPDARNWEALEGLAPTGYVGGRFLHAALDHDLKPLLTSWSPNGAPEPIEIVQAPTMPALDPANPPDQLDYSSSDGLDCRSAHCFLSGRYLYLVP